jgi:hypothetical protein
MFTKLNYFFFEINVTSINTNKCINSCVYKCINYCILNYVNWLYVYEKFVLLRSEYIFKSLFI